MFKIMIIRISAQESLNAIASVQFLMGGFDLTLNVLYRPEARLYDTLRPK